jgi:hypothetical protein
MRAISSAVVLLSGTVLVLAAVTPGNPPEWSRQVIGGFGAVLMLCGLIVWVVEFLKGKDRT